MEMGNLGFGFIPKSQSDSYFTAFAPIPSWAFVLFSPSESGISALDRSKRFKERGNPILVITTVLGFHEAYWIETEESDGHIEYRESHYRKEMMEESEEGHE